MNVFKALLSHNALLLDVENSHPEKKNAETSNLITEGSKSNSVNKDSNKLY